MADYVLSKEAQDELNVNKDFSEKPEVEKPEVEKPEVEKPEVEKPEVEKPEVEKPEVEKSENKPDDDIPPEEGKEEEPEGREDNKDESEKDVKSGKTNDDKPIDDKPEFETKVIEYVSKFDEEKKGKFLGDLENWEKFTATSTQRHQDAADLERDAKELFSLIGGDKVKEALGNEELLEALDEWYGEKEKNPFRTIESEKIESHSKEKELIKNKELELETEKEILAVQRIDKGYEDDEKLRNLGDYADELGTTLIVAAKLKEVEQKDDAIKTLNKTIQDTQKELKETKKELKKRNDDYQKLEKESAPILKPGASEIAGAERVGFSKENASFEDVAAGLIKTM